MGARGIYSEDIHDYSKKLNSSSSVPHTTQPPLSTKRIAPASELPMSAKEAVIQAPGVHVEDIHAISVEPNSHGRSPCVHRSPLHKSHPTATSELPASAKKTVMRISGVH